MTQTLDQQRARDVYGVRGRLSNTTAFNRALRRVLDDVVQRARTSGLSQCLAYLEKKGTDEYIAVKGELERWLNEAAAQARAANDTAYLRDATEESIAWLLLLRRVTANTDCSGHARDGGNGPVPSLPELPDEGQLERRAPDHHAGLWLDKYVPSVKQEEQKPYLEALSKSEGDQELLDRLLARRERVLRASDAVRFEGATLSPMALHLARAGALENAGICLHPLYGFVYIPGPGLKGMARSYAERVWLETKQDPDARQEAWAKIEQVFGWAPRDYESRTGNTEWQKVWRGADVTRPTESSAGAVVFHDAWPTAWPKIVVEGTTCHHRHYYDAKTAAFGDWEEPKPVSFPVAAPDSQFAFALSKREPWVDDELLQCATHWLRGALTYMGVGAKTIQGYGFFTVGPIVGDDAEARKTEAAARWAVHEDTLTLVSPAFFAGIGQTKDECDLRPASLRGQLRWWWRTLHAGHLNVNDLLRLENVLWGSTEGNGLIDVFVGAGVGLKKEPLTEGNLRSLAPSYSHLDRVSNPLLAMSYGMAEMEREKRENSARFFLEPGASWPVRLRGRAVQLDNGHVISKEDALAQGRDALWLLCTYGGVGGKNRKGFGALRCKELAYDVEGCKTRAQRLRASLALGNNGAATQTYPAIEHAAFEARIVQCPNAWDAIARVGDKLKAFIRDNPDDLKRGNPKPVVTLGLPRGPRSPEGGNAPEQHGRPIKRHPSLIQIRVEPKEETKWLVRLTGFPSQYLAGWNTTRDTISKAMEALRPEDAEAGKGDEETQPRKSDFVAVRDYGGKIDLEKCTGVIKEKPNARKAIVVLDGSGEEVEASGAKGCEVGAKVQLKKLPREKYQIDKG